MEVLKGVVPIVAAPFTESGADVDYEDLRNIVELLISEGVHGLALLGVASEFYKISDEERRKMIEVTIEQTAKRVPVVVNITTHATALAVKDAQHARDAGADMLMIIPPHYMPPSNADIIHHIESIARVVDLPLMIQYAPDVTGVGIPVEVFLRISEQQNQQMYIKAESVPTGSLVSALHEKTKGKMGVFIGNLGRQMMDCLHRGALGVMPGSSMAKVYLDIYNEYRSGNPEKALEMYNKLLPIVNFIGQTAESMIKYEKMILKRRGIIKNDTCRKPCYTPDDSYIQLLDQYNEYTRKEFDYPLY